MGPTAIFAPRELGLDDVGYGSEADICAATIDVRFTPNSDSKSRHSRCQLCVKIATISGARPASERSGIRCNRFIAN